MSERLFDAIEFAARAHRGQLRKLTRAPYLIHPLAVAETLILWQAAEVVVVAGVLHDTVEDTDATLADLAARFGPDVAALVEVVSEPDKALPWEARKEHTLAGLRAGPLEAVQLACADKLDNVRSMLAAREADGEAALWAGFKRGRDAQRWYLGGVLDLARARAPEARWTRDYARAVEALFGAG